MRHVIINNPSEGDSWHREGGIESQSGKVDRVPTDSVTETKATREHVREGKEQGERERWRGQTGRKRERHYLIKKERGSTMRRSGRDNKEIEG